MPSLVTKGWSDIQFGYKRLSSARQCLDTDRQNNRWMWWFQYIPPTLLQRFKKRTTHMHVLTRVLITGGKCFEQCVFGKMHNKCSFKAENIHIIIDLMHTHSCTPITCPPPCPPPPQKKKKKNKRKKRSNCHAFLHKHGEVLNNALLVRQNKHRVKAVETHDNSQTYNPLPLPLFTHTNTSFFLSPSSSSLAKGLSYNNSVLSYSTAVSHSS